MSILFGFAKYSGKSLFANFRRTPARLGLSNPASLQSDHSQQQVVEKWLFLDILSSGSVEIQEWRLSGDLECFRKHGRTTLEERKQGKSQRHGPDSSHLHREAKIGKPEASPITQTPTAQDQHFGGRKFPG
jgi:hypothetical protein